MEKVLPNAYLLATGVLILTYMIIWGVKALLCTKMDFWIRRDKYHWDDIVVGTASRTSHFFILVTSIHVAMNFIKKNKVMSLWGWRIFFLVLMWQIAIWTYHLLDKWIAVSIQARLNRNPAAASSLSLVKLVLRLFLFSVIFLFTLSNLGIKITTIVAGLGVGGIAVALALQKILGDLFSSLSIVLDKPFVIGDFIIVDQYLGSVEKIGLKTTRIRSLSGEQIIISNSDLLGSRIRNYKRMHERRVVFPLSLTHDMSADDLKSAVSLISAIVRSKNRVRFERCHFMKISPSSLDIETVYWVLSDEHELHMNIQQEILLEIRQAFKLSGIHFAFPTTEILMKRAIVHPKKGPDYMDSVVS